MALPVILADVGAALRSATSASGGRKGKCSVAYRRRRRTSRACSPGSEFGQTLLLQIAALEIGCHRPLYDRSPIAILRLITLVIDLLEGVQR